MLQGKRRFNVIIAGRRWRKTTLAIPLAVETALRGGTVIWGAPVYDQVMTGFEEALRATSGIASARTSPHPRLRFFVGGGEILFRSLDRPDTSRSKTADRVIVDEAPYCESDSWHGILRPMLMDTNGDAFILGTPLGHNWVYDEFRKGQPDSETYDPGYVSWSIPTRGAIIRNGELIESPHPYENPHVPFSEIRSLFRDLPERTFRQEILAEFLADGGDVFRGVHAAVYGPPLEPAAGETYLIGVDWGRHNDFTVFVAIRLRDMKVVGMDRFAQIGWELQRDRLFSFCARWRHGGTSSVIVYAESNAAGEVQIEALNSAALEEKASGLGLWQHRAFRPDHAVASDGPGIFVNGFETTAITKPIIIDTLAMLIERREIGLPQIEVLLNELIAYQGERTSRGGMKYGAPAKKHDDCVMALAIAAYHARQMRVPTAPARIIIPEGWGETLEAGGI